MALADEIAVKLGLSTAQFKAALKDAGADIRNFTKEGQVGTETFANSMKGLNNTFKQLQVLLAAGGLRAVLGFFEDLAEKAKASKDIIDENIDSTRRWGEEWTEFKNSFTGGAIQILGFVAEIGRNAGDMISSLIGGVKNLFGAGGFVEGFRATADEIIRANAAEKQTRQDMLETNAEIERRKTAMKAVADEKKRALDADKEAIRVLKEQYDQELKLQDATRELAAIEFKARVEKMNTQEKTAAYAAEILKLESEISKFTQFIAQGGKLTLQGTQDLIELKKQVVALTQEQAKAEENITKQMKGQYDIGILKISSGIQTYGNKADQAAYEKGLVEQTKRELQNQINEIQGKIDMYLSGGSSFGAYELPALQERMRELQARKQNVQGYIFDPRYQDALGRGIFGSQVESIGDPLRLQGEQTESLKTVANGIDQINERLRLAGFGTNG